MVLADDLRQALSTNPNGVVFVIGTGVPAGALRGSTLAALCSWGGLLESGLERAHELHAIDDEMLDYYKKGLSLLHKGAKAPPNAHINTANVVMESLGGRDGGEFGRWLRETTGKFVDHVKDSSVLEALALHQKNGVLILTTNYDHLLENATSLKPATWRQRTHVERALRGEEPRILHVHGEWDAPDSIILCSSAYSEVRNDTHAVAVLQTLRTSKMFVFIGCGAGLQDPNMGALLKWSGETFAHSEARHYRLCLEKEVETLKNEHPREQRIFPLPYGIVHEDLNDFLRSLLPNANPLLHPHPSALPPAVDAASSLRTIEQPNISSADMLGNQFPGMSTGGLIAFGPNIVIQGRLAGHLGAIWVVQVEKFWQGCGDLNALLDFCSDSTPANDRFVVFSALLDARPLCGKPRVVCGAQHYEVHISIGSPWLGGTFGSDIDLTRVHNGDIAHRSVADSLSTCLTRRLKHERTKVSTYLYQPWLRRLTAEDPQFENVLRLAVTIACRLPSISYATQERMQVALLDKVVSVNLLEPHTDEDMSQFHKVQICAQSRQLVKQQLWAIDIRLTEGPREFEDLQGPWILLSRNPTEIPLKGGGKIVPVRGVNFVSAQLTSWHHLPPKFKTFRERFVSAGAIKIKVEGRRGLTSDEIVAAAQTRPGEFIWTEFVRAEDMWKLDAEGDRIRARLLECVNRSDMLNHTTRTNLGALYDLAAEAGYIAAALTRALEDEVSRVMC